MDEETVVTKYADADGYDDYMGVWSAALSPPFIGFADVVDGGTVLDVGCGTGNLLASVATAFPQSRLFGVDPSPALLDKARRRPELARATLLKGTAESLPLGGETADFTLSMLVLQEFPDRQLALGGIRQATRSGGTVAACQWDFAKMPIISALMQAIAQAAPDVAVRISSGPARPFSDESELSECWKNAGFVDVVTGRLRVSRTYSSFDSLWRSLLAGTTPSTLALASLEDAVRVDVRQDVQQRLRMASKEGSVSVDAEALVVRGRCFQDFRPRL